MLRTLAVGGDCGCLCADFLPLIRTDKKTNNLAVEIAAMAVLRMRVPTMFGGPVPTHALLACYYKLRGISYDGVTLT
jgi:hypothetical protein